MRLLKGLIKFGTRIYRTDVNGEITIVINNKGKIKVKKIIDDS